MSPRTGGASSTGPAVVVTGMGSVHAGGVGPSLLAAALRCGRAPLSPAEPLPGLRRRRGSSSQAVLVGQIPTADWIAPLKARRMSRPSRFAVIAAKEALRQASLEPKQDPDPDTAVVLATALGPAEYTQRLMDQILDEGPAAASPALFTECVANAPAAQIGIHCGAGGTNLTLCQREAGPLLATARGASLIATGRARRVLVGAVEEITPLTHAVLDRFGALSATVARPFDRRRDGFHAAEGASVLVLEDESAARARGARPLLRIRSWASAFDPTASMTSWGTGDATLAHAVRRMLDRCGLRHDDIDLVVSGASGARAGDRLEARCLARIWDGRGLPPLLAPKAVTGEYGGAFLVAAALALDGCPCHGNDERFEVDEALGVTPHVGEPPTAARALVSSLAAGGAAVWLVAERP